MLISAIHSALGRGAGHYAGSSSAWQLASGHFISAKMPMRAITPRPDSETNSWARHRNAYADGTFQYRYPVSIQGGSYPLYYEIITGPSGLTIGSTHGDTDYGIVTWTPTAGQISGTPYTVTARVHDQDLNTLDVTWTITARGEDGTFIWFDPNVSAGGTGTKADPIDDLNLAYQDYTGSTNPYVNKILVLRTGTQYLSGYVVAAWGTGKFFALGRQGSSAAANNPIIMVGYPGDSPVVDTTNATYRMYDLSDFFVGGIKFQNVQVGINNSSALANELFLNLEVANPTVRSTLFENTFDNYPYYTGGDSNQAIYMSMNNDAHQYVSITHNTLTNYGIDLYHSFAWKYGLIANNTWVGTVSAVASLIGLKADNQYFTIRENKAPALATVSQAVFLGAMRFGVQDTTMIEECYNIWPQSSPDGLSTPGYIVKSGSSTNLASTVYFWTYRNSIYGKYRRNGDYNWVTAHENNVYIDDTGIYTNGDSDSSGTTCVITDTGSVTFVLADNVIDGTDGHLINGAATYIGTKGADIA